MKYKHMIVMLMIPALLACCIYLGLYVQQGSIAKQNESDEVVIQKCKGVGGLCKTSKACCSKVCVHGTCRKGKLPMGQSCGNNGDCKSGFCSANICASCTQYNDTIGEGKDEKCCPGLVKEYKSSSKNPLSTTRKPSYICKKDTGSTCKDTAECNKGTTCTNGKCT